MLSDIGGFLGVTLYDRNLSRFVSGMVFDGVVLYWGLGNKWCELDWLDNSVQIVRQVVRQIVTRIVRQIGNKLKHELNASANKEMKKLEGNTL